MKIVDAMWFTQMGAEGILGIVKVERSHGGGFEFFIGTAGGDHEESDAQHIAATGAVFNPNNFAAFAEAGAIIYVP